MSLIQTYNDSQGVLKVEVLKAEVPVVCPSTGGIPALREERYMLSYISARPEQHSCPN